MRSLILTALIACWVVSVPAQQTQEDVKFTRCKLVVQHEEYAGERSCHITFSDSSMAVESYKNVPGVGKSDIQTLTIPYGAITKMAYESTSSFFSKRHWLKITYRDGDKLNDTMFKRDKKEQMRFRSVAERRVGKEIASSSFAP